MMNELVTKYQERYAFKSTRDFKEFVQKQIRYWEKFEHESAKIHPETRKLSESWFYILNELNDLRPVGQGVELMSIVLNRVFQDLESWITQKFSQISILIYDSIEGKAVRRIAEEGPPQIYAYLVPVLLEFDKKRQVKAIEKLPMPIKSEIEEIIIECTTQSGIGNNSQQSISRKTFDEKVIHNIVDDIIKKNNEEINAKGVLLDELILKGKQSINKSNQEYSHLVEVIDDTRHSFNLTISKIEQQLSDVKLELTQDKEQFENFVQLADNRYLEQSNKFEGDIIKNVTLYNDMILKGNQFISTSKKESEDLAEELRLIGKTKIGEIDEKINEETELFKEMISKNSEFIETSEKERNNLKSAFKEKIAISEPMIYWENRRKNYFMKSWLWGIASIVFGGLFIALLWIALVNIPDLASITDVKNQIKVTVLFITGIGIMSYILNIFGRLFLSSLHLLSDLDERTNLTHFYLSLIEGGGLDEKQREIILQSLFSRTDSGIIKGGSEVNFPGGLDFLKALLKSK